MVPLDIDLQQKRNSIDEFTQITKRVLDYLPNVISSFKDKEGYRIYSSVIAGTTRYIRPIKLRLFIQSPESFESKFNDFKVLISKLKKENNNLSLEEKTLIDSVLYTIQQSIGAGLDLLVNPNSARKHMGNRFEELIKAVLSEAGISNKKTVLQIPYRWLKEIKFISAKMI